MRFLFYSAIASSLVAALICIYFFDSGNSYVLLTGYPILFIIHFLFIFNKKFIYKFPITSCVYAVMQYIRFVIMPPVILTSTSPGFQHLEPKVTTIFEASIYVVYELFFLTLFIKIFQIYAIRARLPSIANLSLKGSKLGYLFFVFLCLVLYFIYPGAKELINFVYIPISTEGGERLGDVTDTTSVLIRQLFIIGVMFLFFLAITYSKANYLKRSNTLYIAIFFAVLTVLIIVGERRTAQVYSAFSAILILSALFPQERKKIFLSIFLPAILVLIFMSIYKFLGAFVYGSYSEAMSEGSFVSKLPSLLQIYFFGPQNVALSIDFAKNDNNDMFGFLYDIFRSIFGLSFFLKNEMDLTSVRFNEYIYGPGTNTGQVLSSFSYGAIYFGIVAAPVMTCINFSLSVFFEILMKKSNSIEFYYIFSIATVRFSTNILGPTPALISYVSILLGITGSICAFFIFIRTKGGVK